MAFFQNEENCHTANWQITTDRSIVIIKTECFPQGFRDGITKNICDKPRFKSDKVFIYNCLLVQTLRALYRNEWCLQTPWIIMYLGLNDRN